jgi:hypothetical protein
LFEYPDEVIPREGGLVPADAKTPEALSAGDAYKLPGNLGGRVELPRSFR